LLIAVSASGAAWAVDRLQPSFVPADVLTLVSRALLVTAVPFCGYSLYIPVVKRVADNAASK